MSQLKRGSRAAAGLYRCDRCGAEVAGRRLRRTWHRRGASHICPECWPAEPTERSAVWRYAAWSVDAPAAFWSYQRGARCLWDGLCAVSEIALQRAAEMRAQYAPIEAADATAAREAARAAWQQVEIARQAWRTSTNDGGNLRAMYEEQRDVARGAGRRLIESYGAAKKAAKAAGCDESAIWTERLRAIAAAPLWTYREQIVDGRQTVERASPGWCLPRDLADQVCEDYQRAWAAWLSGRKQGRGMPRAHGQGLRGEVRFIARYTGGQTLNALETSTRMNKCRVIEVRRDMRAQGQRKGGRFVDVVFACGDRELRARVHVDRPIPDAADAIRAIALVGRRWADRWQWQLCVTCRTPAPRRAASDDRIDAIAVDLRWRQVPDEPTRLMVAEWAGSEGSAGQVLIDRAATRQRQLDAGLPSSWIDYQLWQSVSDWCLEGTKQLIWSLYGTADTYTPAFRLMRGGGLERAIRRGDYPLLTAQLLTWQEWHLTMQRRLARLRDRLIARRDQLYYETAHSLCRRARTIVLESERARTRAMDLRQLIEADDAPAPGQRQLLAPGRLRLILRQVAPLYGTEIDLQEKHLTSITCPECGLMARATAGTRRWATCPVGHRFRPPVAACEELLRRWRERRGGTATPGITRAVEGADTAGDSAGPEAPR